MSDHTVTIEKHYDEVPYPGHPYPQSHPDYLATLAALFGMSAPPVDQCRVLELGCGCGGNLIPMAEALPNSVFVGVDLSGKQIADGNTTIQSLGLRNITLHHKNMLDIDTLFGQFDYIIAHGVYSWVPEPVQDKLLAICRQNLSPNGIAYVSYNTYPGWHMFTMMRDMMRYHTWDSTDPRERTARSRALLEFLVDSVPEENQAFGDFLTAYIAFLNRKLEQAGDQSDAFLIHDELADINTPVYFYQFINHAARHGLQYITETDIPGVMPGNYPAQVYEKLRGMSRNLIDMEQYLDFLRGRTFRETLLCHQGVRLDRMLKPGRLMSLHVASRARPVSARPDIASSTAEAFRASDGGTVAIEHTLSKAAMLYLAQIWPRSVPFSTLVRTARSRVKQALGEEQETTSMAREETLIAANLLKAYTSSQKLVQFHVSPPMVTQTASDYPVVRPLARLQARRFEQVTNMYHERVRLDRLHRILIQHMDGTRDHAALAKVLERLEQQHAPATPPDEPPPRKKTAEDFSLELEKHLQWLVQAALVVG